jgi:Na+-driven multidrug efflux pump
VTNAVSQEPALPLSGAPPQPALEPGRFTSGSILGHVARMTATASVGLLAVFAVDAFSLFYVGFLNDPVATAAVGYASTIVFVLIAVAIGVSIASAALVSRALGAGKRELARDQAAGSLIQMTIALTAMGAVVAWFAGDLVALLGAEGRAAELAVRYLLINMPALPLFGLGIGYAAVLRAVGDARGAMNVTLGGAAVAAILDPLLIIGLGLGIDGAALAAVAARAGLVYVGWRGAVRRHRLVARPTLAIAAATAAPVWAIAAPAVLTNVATPVANGFVFSVASRFGDQVVAAATVIDRLTPVAFCGLFALSGAVGPIIGQNYGAGQFDRMRDTLKASFAVTAIYVAAVWAALAFAAPGLAWAFGLQGEAAELVAFFCRVAVLGWAFVGALFVANAAFNTLDHPLLSTAFNWGRATLGTIPLVALGAEMAGPRGVLMGQAAGGLLFGLGAAAASFMVVNRLARRAARRREVAGDAGTP